MILEHELYQISGVWAHILQATMPCVEEGLATQNARLPTHMDLRLWAYIAIRQTTCVHITVITCSS